MQVLVRRKVRLLWRSGSLAKVGEERATCANTASQSFVSLGVLYYLRGSDTMVTGAGRTGCANTALYIAAAHFSLDTRQLDKGGDTMCPPCGVNPFALLPCPQGKMDRRDILRCFR